MSGVTEILLIVAIIVAVFMLPRMMSRRPESDTPHQGRGLPLSGRMRIAVLASLLWPAIMAILLEPWNGCWVVFFYAAVGPIVLLWGIYWVFSGFRKEKGRRS